MKVPHPERRAPIDSDPFTSPTYVNGSNYVGRLNGCASVLLDLKMSNRDATKGTVCLGKQAILTIRIRPDSPGRVR